MDTIDELIEMLEIEKEKESAIKALRIDLETRIFIRIRDELRAGKSKFDFEKYKLTVTETASVKVDQEIAGNYPSFFKKKYEMSFSQFKKIEKDEACLTAITITPTKPIFKFEKKEEV